MLAILGLCVGLAALAGFAVQRGSICVVAAARDGVLQGRWGAFLAFGECAAWALGLYVLLDGLGLRAITTYEVRASIGAALLGGALFGCGALLNGACAYGAAGRLAAGETSFLVMVAGFFLGVELSQRLLLGQFSLQAQSFAVSGPALIGLIVLLLLFVGLQAWRAKRALPSVGAVARRLRAKKWPASQTMVVIALSNVGLIALLSHWTYTGLLIDLAAGHTAQGWIRALLALVFLGGAAWGAVSAGRFRWRGFSWRELCVRGAGGTLMGAGAALIPGGNDGLVITGVPLLLGGALVAYCSLSAVVLAGFAIQRHRAATLV